MVNPKVMNTETCKKCSTAECDSFLSEHHNLCLACFMETQGLVNVRSLRNKESKMSKHPNKVEGLTAVELADKFAKTTYGNQAEFFKLLTDLYLHESMADKKRGYTKLAQLLSYVSTQIGGAWIRMLDVWDLCKGKTEVEDEPNESTPIEVKRDGTPAHTTMVITTTIHNGLIVGSEIETTHENLEEDENLKEICISNILNLLHKLEQELGEGTIRWQKVLDFVNKHKETE